MPVLKNPYSPENSLTAAFKAIEDIQRGVSAFDWAWNYLPADVVEKLAAIPTIEHVGEQNVAEILKVLEGAWDALSAPPGEPL